MVFIRVGSWLQYAYKAIVCPEKLTVFESTFMGLKMALEVLSRAQRLGLKIIQNVEENLICLMNIESCLQDAN